MTHHRNNVKSNKYIGTERCLDSVTSETQIILCNFPFLELSYHFKELFEHCSKHFISLCKSCDGGGGGDGIPFPEWETECLTVIRLHSHLVPIKEPGQHCSYA